MHHLARSNRFWGDWLGCTGTAGRIAPQARLHSRNSRTVEAVAVARSERLERWQGLAARWQGGTVGAVATVGARHWVTLGDWSG